MRVSDQTNSGKSWAICRAMAPPKEWPTTCVGPHAQPIQ